MPVHNFKNIKSWIYSICFIGVLTLFTALKSQAQRDFFKATAVAGFNFSQIDGDRFGGYDKLGLNIGIGISHSFSDQLRAGFEMNFSQKGSKKRIDPKAQFAQTFVIKSTYIDLPILAYFSPTEESKFTFMAGPNFGVYSGGTIDDGAIVRDAEFRKFDLALLLGVEYQLTESLGAQLRHSTSLIRIGDQFANGLNVWNRIGMYNRFFTIALAFHI
jgi:hypothetical protein